MLYLTYVIFDIFTLCGTFRSRFSYGEQNL